MGFFLIMTVAFLGNTALTARAVSRKDYGWASAYALSAIWAAIFAALESSSMQ
jgi:hypothetical protein